ncbi:MAG TPA: hypothetical protein VF260_09070 [Bacilli bacterium]
MKISQEELGHLAFLSQVVLEQNKRHLMSDTLRCLLYVIKSLTEVEVPGEIKTEIMRLVARLEAQLKTENERIQEIWDNLADPAYLRARKNLENQ